jgi:hypothetical protein
MAPDFGGKPWSWFHHLSVLSAVAANPGAELLFWYEHEPDGQWWRASRPHLTLCPIEAPREIFGRPLVHPAHRADVVRLQVLLEHGGAYVDSDVWCLRPFANLEHGGWWMGRQGDDYGLCNATMGGDRGARFAELWLAEYRSFRSAGRDEHWDEHSVRLPLRLAAGRPDLVTIYPPTVFFAPLWGKLRTVFKVPNHRRTKPLLADSYSVHLWESICWPWLSKMRPGNISRQSEIGSRLRELGVL